MIWNQWQRGDEAEIFILASAAFPEDAAEAADWRDRKSQAAAGRCVVPPTPGMRNGHPEMIDLAVPAWVEATDPDVDAAMPDQASRI